MSTESKCPVVHHIGMGKGPRNLDWWPNALDVGALHAHPSTGNPLGVRVNAVCPGGVNTPLAKNFRVPENPELPVFGRLMSLVQPVAAKSCHR